MTRRKPFHRDEVFFNFEVKELLNQLFTLHLQAESFLNEIKMELDYDMIVDLFYNLDIDNKGYLTMKEVRYIIGIYHL